MTFSILHILQSAWPITWFMNKPVNKATVSIERWCKQYLWSSNKLDILQSSKKFKKFKKFEREFTFDSDSLTGEVAIMLEMLSHETLVRILKQHNKGNHRQRWPSVCDLCVHQFAIRWHYIIFAAHLQVLSLLPNVRTEMGIS